LLAFTSVYFFESGLFNVLRPIQIKKSAPSLAPAKRSGLSHPSSPSSIGTPPGGAPQSGEEKCITHFLFFCKIKQVLIALAIAGHSSTFRFFVMAGRDPAIHENTEPCDQGTDDVT
jgi:hypothetical protein